METTMMESSSVHETWDTNQEAEFKTSGSSSSLLALKQRSSKRKQLLAKSLGASSTEDLSALLGTQADRQAIRRPQFSLGVNAISSPPLLPLTKEVGSCGPFVLPKLTTGDSVHSGSGKGNVTGGSTKHSRRAGPDSDSEEDEKVVIDDYFKVLQAEEQEYTGSSTFLKGTQSANPHNDYSQHFVDSGHRPQNFIRDPGLAERFEEYPKLKELIKLKDDLVAKTATPPMYLQVDLSEFDLRELGSRFDVILIEPPLPEYQAKAGILSGKQVWTWDMIESLDIGSIADSRCFLWMWCGSGPEGTARGRQCFRRWGFRRCEDICWVKRNTNNPGVRQQLEPDSIFQRTKEHCLMGIKGTVRRSLDGDFIHANVDIDLVITEEPSGPDSVCDPRAKPEETFLVAEHFCLGRRRLHIFGRDDTLRPVVSRNLWMTSKTYRNFFEKGGKYTTGCSERIESLRPKSPVPMDRSAGGAKREGPPAGPGVEKPRHKNKKAPAQRGRHSSVGFSEINSRKQGLGKPGRVLARLPPSRPVASLRRAANYRPPLTVAHQPRTAQKLFLKQRIGASIQNKAQNRPWRKAEFKRRKQLSASNRGSKRK